MEQNTLAGLPAERGFPLLLIEGDRRQTYWIARSPFTLGRSPDRDVVLTQRHISREHARIVLEDGDFWIEDTGSRHGTYRSGERIRRAQLSIGDELQLGGPEGPLLLFGLEKPPDNSLRGLLSGIGSEESELGKLRWFVEAARRLNAIGTIDQILAALVDTALELTHFERGYVFLQKEGRLTLAAGRNDRGETLQADANVSQTAIQNALATAEPYILTDTLTAEPSLRSESMVSKNIRAVVAMPLRKRPRGEKLGEVMGVLYLDSHMTPGRMSDVDHGLLRTVAAEAAGLVENAELVGLEESARRHREELAIAAGIQQRLLPTALQRLDFAKIDGHSVACKDIGGDFFDVLAGKENLAVAVVDVCGKGTSAAILASTLQGMVYSHLQTGMGLASLAAAVNGYLCARNTGKYATMVLVRMAANGHLEYINCGHVEPLLIRPVDCGETCTVIKLEGSNLPVGLIPGAEYTVGEIDLLPKDRLLLVSDGVTEAENAEGEFFGEERLVAALSQGCTGIRDVLSAIQEFCGAFPANDDRTLVEIEFSCVSA